jgi:hypothetical protein
MDAQLMLKYVQFGYINVHIIKSVCGKNFFQIIICRISIHSFAIYVFEYLCVTFSPFSAILPGFTASVPFAY